MYIVNFHNLLLDNTFVQFCVSFLCLSEILHDCIG